MNKDLKEDLKKQKEEAVQLLRAAIVQNHQQWLEHPTTQTILSAVRKHKEAFVGLISANVGNSAMPDAAFRALAVNIRNTDAILLLLTDSKVLSEFMISTESKE